MSDITISNIIFLLAIRTLGFWLQQWQIREYRWDRLRDHLFHTREGAQKLFNLWFFPGLLPRPKISGRIILIIIIFCIFTALELEIIFILMALFQDRFFDLYTRIPFPLAIITILWERSIFWLVASSVFISKIPIFVLQQQLFHRTKSIIDQYPNIIRIGITGSFGKSSTKEILVHLLISKFGAEHILYNPRNENNEVSIARLITRSINNKIKIMVIEMGAYHKGEIQKVCNFVQPHIGIITGINDQHLSLFGSQKNIQETKFELAEAVSQKIFFNSESPLLAEIFADKKIHATDIPISSSAAKNKTSHKDGTSFEIYGKKMLLPWRGEFFVQNALLAMECAREFGITPDEMAQAISHLPPLQRALHEKKLNSGAILLSDPYSANPDGVLAAISELQKFPGRKIFVGIPLIELGKNSKNAHEEIFYKLKTMKAEIFWLKSDYKKLGKSICKNNFFGKNIKKLKQISSELKTGDGILLESRLPQKIEHTFLKILI